MLQCFDKLCFASESLSLFMWWSWSSIWCMKPFSKTMYKWGRARLAISKRPWFGMPTDWATSLCLVLPTWIFTLWSRTCEKAVSHICGGHVFKRCSSDILWVNGSEPFSESGVTEKFSERRLQCVFTGHATLVGTNEVIRVSFTHAHNQRFGARRNNIKEKQVVACIYFGIHNCANFKPRFDLTLKYFQLRPSLFSLPRSHIRIHAARSRLDPPVHHGECAAISLQDIRTYKFVGLTRPQPLQPLSVSQWGWLRGVMLLRKPCRSEAIVCLSSTRSLMPKTSTNRQG